MAPPGDSPRVAQMRRRQGLAALNTLPDMSYHAVPCLDDGGDAASNVATYAIDPRGRVDSKD
jgi:hypothetical protein